MKLLPICIYTTYQEQFGMALESRILSNLYMENLKQASIRHQIIINTFAIWPNGVDTIDRFLLQVNVIKKTIKFSMRMEVDNKIHSVDISGNRTSYGILKVKLSHTR